MYERLFVHVFRPLAIAALTLGPLAPGAALATATAPPQKILPITPNLLAKPSPTPTPAAGAPAKLVPHSFAKSVGAFYLTLPDGTKLPLSAMIYDVKQSTAMAATGASSGRPKQLATLTIPDADAVALLTATSNGKAIPKIVVTAPNSTVTFTEALPTTTRTTASGTAFTLAFSSAVLATSAPPITTSSTAARSELAKPSLQFGDQGFVLTSETFSTTARASVTGAASSNATSPTAATFVFKPGDAVALFGAMNVRFTTAKLATNDATYALDSPVVTETSAVYDSGGTPTITANVQAIGYRIATTDTTPLVAGDLYASLPVAGGSKNVPLQGLTLHLATSGASATGASSGHLTAQTGSLAIADAAAIVLAQNALQNGTHDVGVYVKGTTMNFTDVKITAITQQSAATTFAFSFIGMTTTAPAAVPPSTIRQTGDAASVAPLLGYKPSLTIASVTYPLKSETVSSTAASGAAAAQKGSSSTNIVFQDPAPVKLYTDATQRTTLGTVQLATTAGTYELAQSFYRAVDLAIVADGTPKIAATLGYGGIKFNPPTTGPTTATKGSFYGTFTAEKALTSPVLPLGAGTFEIAQPDVSPLSGSAGGKAVLSASLSVPTPLAGELLVAATNGTGFSTITITSPSGVITLHQVKIGATSSSSASGIALGAAPAMTTFTLAFASISLPTNVSAPTSSAVPRLTIGNSAAYGLASETLTSQASAHTTSAPMTASVVFSDASAIPLFAATQTNQIITAAKVVTSSLSISLTRGVFSDVKIVFAPTGLATTSATFSFAQAVVSAP